MPLRRRPPRAYTERCKLRRIHLWRRYNFCRSVSTPRGRLPTAETMIFDIITIFPDFFASILKHGVLHRALDSGKVEVRIHDLRDFTDDPHRSVDDRPFGGGPGMVFKPEPIFRAVESIEEETGGAAFPVILLSPQGRLLRQPVVEELANLESSAPAGSARIALICGRYEGVDNRVQEALATDELSIGDYVLSGGGGVAPGLMGGCCHRPARACGHPAPGGEGTAWPPAAPA